MASRHLRAGIAALALAATAAAFGACGGPEVHLGTGGEIASTPGQFSAAAGSVCRQVARSFAEAQREAPRTFSQGAAITERLIEIARDGEEQLAALGPPEEEAKAFDLYLQARGEVVDQLERARDAALAEDGAAYERARQEAAEGASRRSELAERAGLDGCAELERGGSDD
ncbi:MAG: hypothetical protein U0R24_06585 [Solirubrobacterales bacterium]